MRILKLTVFICCVFLGGCGPIVNYFTPEKLPLNSQLFESYRQIEMDKSTSTDVLNLISMPDSSLLSQSKSVIASTGQQKEGYKTWFIMAGFNENEMAVKRKYFFAIDEKPKVLCKSPWTGLRLDCDVLLPAKVLSEPYANENVKRIAIIKQVLEDFRKDIAEVRQDYHALSIAGMLVNQSLGSVITTLNASPALATRLSEPAGVKFSHINLRTGKMQMVVVNDIARIKIRLGSFVDCRLSGDEVYKCPKCCYIYDPFVGDPKYGIKPAGSIDVLPECWVCPVCAEAIKKE